ncbi:MAG TPA: diphosphomevalonate decarboxylase [Candidatus Bathyarchaeia archaeon]|nr:diphosphomevalonate decarboxylase [Candidatus Bathyarchaeia archaeon]
MKATAKSPTNIAFIKYWGKRDESLRIPENDSIAMNIDGLYTVTTVEFADKYKKDSFYLKNELVDKKEAEKVFIHLDRIRKLAKIDYKAKVVSYNNFPKSTGLSSSASGFAALTLAAAKAAGLKLSERELSRLARVASGSACRSIPNGFVEWRSGKDDKTSYAYSVFPAGHWLLYDVVVIVSEEKKEIGSTEGQKLAKTSPFLEARLRGIRKKIILLKRYLKQKKFSEFGKLAEEEALNMHAVMITSSPPLLYWTANTLKLMKLIQKWRQEGLENYFTINTGQDVHILVLKNNLEKLKNNLAKLAFIKKIIVNQPTVGARIVNKHLF